jgi:LPS-assembly protein
MATVRVQLERRTGFVENPVYRLIRNHAQGQAKRIDFLDEERSVVHQGTYSTCQGVSPDWYLKTETLQLDTGLIRDSQPFCVVLQRYADSGGAFDYLPLSSARHSGFLPPVTGATSKGGVEFGLPYYWNIAPNRDVTLYPKIISRRGLQLGAEARYLGEQYRGESTLEGIVGDRQTSTNRYALTSLHEQYLMPDLKLSWNLNMASDDNYPTDFSNSITKPPSAYCRAICN